MKNIVRLMILSLGAAGLAGCTSPSKPEAAKSEAAKPMAAQPAAATATASTDTNLLNSEEAKVSYAIGMTFGHNFKQQGVEVEPDLLLRGLKDELSGGTTLLTDQEMRETLTAYQKKIIAKQREMREAAAAKNLTEGKVFLEANKAKPGVITLPDGLQYQVVTNGTGPLPAPGDKVTVTYRATFIDGTEFDNSTNRPGPTEIALEHVIPGWAEALKLMPVGSRWKIFIPADLAYGEMGRPPRIQPNSTLIFDTQLLAATPPTPPQPLTSDIVKVPSLEEMKKGAKIEVIKPEDLKTNQATPPTEPAK